MTRDFVSSEPIRFRTQAQFTIWPKYHQRSVGDPLFLWHILGDEYTVYLRNMKYEEILFWANKFSAFHHVVSSENQTKWAPLMGSPNGLP